MTELSAETVQRRLAPRAVRYYDRVDSTNDVALEWLRTGAAAGSAVIADEQMKGRGRLGRTWHTPPGVALAVSVVLRPEAAQVAQVTMLGALAIYDLLEGTGLNDLGIKWPNDVQVKARKICGVLPEAAWDGDRLLGVALGMGVNVRMDFTGTELEDTAISLEPALGRWVNRLDLLESLLDRVDFWYARLGTTALFEVWKSRLTTLGRVVTIENVRGVAENVDADGALLVRDDAGTLRRLLAGDVAFG
ncbi:MAG: biotin--[acetyl-CoA-carboxylase] ligase [Chloroflexi bacterium]|nr:biotin--[acetyl-CoA-carboxylase] ligase [Chloroflexota bacterium]